MDVDGFLANLESRRGKMESYSARFVQTKTLDLFGETKISTGTILYKAPQRMIWKYQTPDRTQMLLERESVSFYFPELEQIEIYPVERGGGASGFFFAFEAGAEELKEGFEISIGASTDEKTNRVDLAPRAGSIADQVSGITLWLDRSDYFPRKIRIREISGDTTRVEFSEIAVNEPIADNEMQFDAPEGTTIIENDAGGF